MKIQTRDKFIKILRKKGLTFREIGNKYRISAERVRQICCGKGSPSQALKLTSKDILQEVKLKYKHKKDINFKELLEDIDIYSQPDRNKNTVQRRNALIVYLYDEVGLSFLKIAKLLKRDHTSILHSYRTYHG